MFSVKLGSAVKRSNAAVSGAAEGVSKQTGDVTGQLGQWANQAQGKVRNAAHAAAHTTTSVLHKGGEAAAAAASTTSHEMGRVLKKGNEALKIDQVATSITTHMKDLNTAATSVGTRANNVFKGKDSAGGRMSLVAGRERRWDEYNSEDDDEDADAGGGEGELTTLEKEVLIAGLTDSEDMGPAVRAVHERGVSEPLVKALEELSAQRSNDILQACDQERALDMMRSVQLMVSLKEEAALSESRLANINARLQSDGARLLQAQSDVVDMRQCQHNLEQADQVLDECISVMRLSCLVRQVCLAVFVSAPVSSSEHESVTISLSMCV